MTPVAGVEAAVATPSTPAGFCPNITKAGRLHRLRVGAFGGFTSVLMLGTFMFLQTPVAFRLAIFFPAAAGATLWLEATRHTCVLMAMRGRHEDDTGRSHPVDALKAAASRLMARTIYRDALLWGVGAAALGAASALVR